MAKDGFTVEDIEEGEISDSASVEEISAEDFKQDIRVSKPKGDSRVWMDDVMKYPISSNYGSGLYNFAWAQAVQNKPLNQSLMREFGSNEKAINSAPNPLVNSRENNNRSLNSSKEVCSVIIDDSSEEIDSRMETVGGDEKEEGELEEGEIDLDSETVDKPEEGSLVERPGEGILSVPSVSETDLKGSDFEKRLNKIRTNLESLTVKDAEKSFPRFCSQLQTSLESLQLMVLESRVPAMDAIIRLSFSRIQDVSSVFHFMNPKQQEQNKDILSRLLANVNRQNPALFSPDQMKEIDAMFRFLDSHNDLLSIKAMDIEKVKHVSNGVNLNEADILSESSAHDMNSSSKKLHLDPISVKSAYQNNITVVPETLKRGMPFGSKNRVNFGPLLDLHRDHDADSLPSPTRETQPPLPLQKPQAVIDGTKSDSATIRVADKMEDTNLHPYETDALKAVSTYQQKFGQSSFLLPSPTPSEEGEDGDGDINGEVSSSSSGSLKTVNAPIPLQTIASATSHTDSLNGQGTIPAKAVGKLGSVSTPILRASAKSRDPRLRYANSDVGALDLNHLPLSVEYNTPIGKPLGEVMSSRKHKAVEDFVLDGHTLKRQRNGLMDSRVSKDVQMVSRSGGWLEDSSSVGPQLTDKNRLVENMGTDPRRLGNGEIGFRKRQDTDGGHFNMSTGGNEQLPATVASTSVSLPSLLKDIAVNPTMLMHLIKIEQQRLAAEAQQKSGDPPNHMMHPSSSNVMLGTVPLVNVASSKPSEPEQNLVVKPQIPTQTASTGEGGKIRMKPRDPRRILHSSNYQKSENLGPEQIKSNEAPLLRTQVDKDNLVVRQQGEQAEANSLSSQSSPSPDIARQFTKNLKNLANILTASQATSTPLIIPHTASQATNTPPIVPYTASQAMNTPPIIPYTASQAANTLPIIPHTVSSQTIPLKTEKMDTRDAVTDSSDQRTVTGLTPEEGAVGPPQNVWEDVEHLFEGYDDQQKAAIQRERARRIEEQKKMFAARKLCLVLDLDHTLLNSAKFVEVDPVHDEILRKKEEQDREKPQRHLFHFPHMGMWTKLRPGIWNFLEKASKLYELHLYTMGNKLYATEMAKVLDPSGVLFAGRVISKGDDGDPFDSDERQPKTKDLDGVLGMESAVVIIDDSIRVWPHNKLNLIVVERYTYFPCSRRQFGLLGPSLLEIDHDERPEDGTLASSLVVIEKMHEKFFSHQSLDDVDVRNILASEQRRILAGCRIVFSRVFPVGEANPHLHPLWQTAEQFGAVCTNQIDEQVTHVVANSLGTDKVNWALSTGRHVVHPGWVEASALLYRRVNELDFAVKI